ncbi:hypothetical protein GCM10022393_33560 [Aquimarina addita]|uniref:Secreted protein n=1 Tax=Aquimarina addita TaxID=870485 RepID=A0ABP6UQ24_9FLAO
MKAIKTIFAVLFVSSMFIACENDNVNEELGVDEVDVELFGDEDADEEEIIPTN